jgi:hypothetical protein
MSTVAVSDKATYFTEDIKGPGRCLLKKIRAIADLSFVPVLISSPVCSCHYNAAWAETCFHIDFLQYSFD